MKTDFKGKKKLLRTYPRSLTTAWVQEMIRSRFFQLMNSQ
jgi:hypothetical protein